MLKRQNRSSSDRCNCWATAYAINETGDVDVSDRLSLTEIEGASGYIDFGRADDLSARARGLGLRVHGHTLVWYAEKPKAFEALAQEEQALDHLRLAEGQSQAQDRREEEGPCRESESAA